MFENLEYFQNNITEALKNGQSGKEEYIFFFKAFFLDLRCLFTTGQTTEKITL